MEVIEVVTFIATILNSVLVIYIYVKDSNRKDKS